MAVTGETYNNADTAVEKQYTYYYHADHLGSTSVVTDHNGEVYERLEYTPYGETWLDETSGNTYFDTPYRFSAKEKDEARTIAGVLCVGLYYYGARYLDPKYSRWISADPALGEYLPQAPINDEAKKHNQSLPGQGGVFNVINLNLYHYAGNNPIKYTDPDGSQVAVTPYGPILVPVLPMHPMLPTKPLQPSSPSNGRILGDDLLMSDTKKSNDGDTSSSQADQAKQNLKDNAQATAPAPSANGGKGSKHGKDDHNKSIDEKAAELQKDPSNRDIRKNQQQVDANGNKVGKNRPDLQWTDKNGVRHYEEWDHSPLSSQNHGNVIKQNDPNGDVQLNILE